MADAYLSDSKIEDNPITDTKGTSSLQKQAEQLFVNKLNGMYMESALHKEYIASEWEAYIRIVRGHQWPGRRPSYKVSAVLNFILENIERKTALLTDAKPRPLITPFKDELQDTADVLNILTKVFYQGSSFEQANADMIENTQVFGSGFLGSIYDTSARQNSGDVRVVSYDPRASYIDPMLLKSYLLCDAEYFILEDVWPLEKAQDLFPDRADEFKANDILSVYSTPQTGSLFRNLVNKVFTRTDNLRRSEIPRVHIREFYVKDRSKDSKGKPRFKNQCRKVLLVNDIIASDGANPYADGEFPVDMMIWHTDFESAWGWGDVELLRNPQELMNKVLATIIENIMLMSNAIWIGDKDALTTEEWKKLTNAPGSYVRKSPGRELRREPGVSLAPNVLETLQHIQTGGEKITGMVDVMRGIRTGQVSSGVGIESLQLMAQALIRLRGRALEAMHNRIGQKIISRIYQYVPPNRVQHIIQMEDKEKMVVAHSTELMKPITQRKQSEVLDLLFTIEPGSGLGLAQTQKRIESMRLREMQVIDDEALLEDLKYPNRKKVITRVAAKRQNEANQEIAGQQPNASRGTQFPNQGGGSPKGRF